MKTLSRIALFMALVCSLAAAKAAEPPADLKAFLAEQLPDYRLSTSGDYRPEVEVSDRGPAFVRDDFDGDGQIDYAVMLVHRRTRDARAYLLLQRETGFQAELLLSQPAAERGGAIKMPLSLKKAGDAGLTAKPNNELQFTPDGASPLPSEELQRLRQSKAAHYVAMPAVVAWKDSAHGLRPSPIAADYCSSSWYVQDSQIKSFKACD